jgi:RNA polymerase sigma-70 factor (ECF subfamily)
MAHSENSYNQENEQTFSSIFRLYFDSLYNYGIRITGNRELTEDCIQEIFFRVWKNNINLTSITNLKSYLFKALRRQILNMLDLKINQISKEEVNENIAIEFSPEDFFVLKQSEERIRNKVIKALQKLPHRQSEAIYLRFFENLGFSEIAVIMNIRVQSVKNSVLKGLTLLKKTL